MARKKNKRKLAGNALKNKLYSMFKGGRYKAVRAKGFGRSVNTRYDKKMSAKMPQYVYVYRLKSR